jgi:peptide/nickel transport system substrate-binding protein
VIITVVDAVPGLAQAAAGELDVWEPLTPTEIPSTSSSEHVRVVTGPGYLYSFLGLNARDPQDTLRPHPLFGDRALRRALTMAVDRDAVRRAAMDSLAFPGLGPFVRAQTTADTTIEQIPFDRAVAEALLDSLGWTARENDGTRRRGAQRLAFTILFPSPALPRMRAAVALQEQLRQVGASVTIRGLEPSALGPAVQSGRFDAVAWTWQTAPSPTALRGSWMSRSIPGAGATNYWAYSNPAFDRAVTDGIAALDLETRRASLRRAYQLIVDDAPAIWLFEARNAAAVHRRFDTPPWRTDAWWLTLGDWTIAPDKRLARDARPATP